MVFSPLAPLRGEGLGVRGEAPVSSQLPPHPTLSPRKAGGRGRQKVMRRRGREFGSVERCMLILPSVSAGYSTTITGRDAAETAKVHGQAHVLERLPHREHLVRKASSSTTQSPAPSRIVWTRSLVGSVPPPIE